jgi:hypothetical protein
MLVLSAPCVRELRTRMAKQEAHFRLLDLTRLNELCFTSSFDWPKGHCELIPSLTSMVITHLVLDEWYSFNLL